MLPTVLLPMAVAWTLGVKVQECPTCVLVNSTCYNVSYMLDLEGNFRKQVVIPKMGILRSTNTLFFSYEPVIEDKEYYKIGFVNLDDNSSAGILSVPDGQILNFGTFDMDQDNNFVYLGGSDGIYVLDTNANKVSSYSSRGDTITNIFYKNKVFFTKHEDPGVIIKNGDNFRTLYENIPMKFFVITKYDVMVFLHFTGLYIAKGNVEHKISDNAFFRGITVDLEGTVYTWWLDGIYKVAIDQNLKKSKLVPVLKLPGIGAMTFDNSNNILFTVNKSLYVLKETKTGCLKLE